MARKDALLRLHQQLVTKKEALRKKLHEDFHDSQIGRQRGGDIADASFDGEQTEIESQVADLETRELRLIEKAIEAIRSGHYGICEGCEEAIPVARLKALPYTHLCVNCQRSMEETGNDPSDEPSRWESAFDFEGRMHDPELTLRDLDQTE